MLRQHRGHSHASISSWSAPGLEGEEQLEPGFEVSGSDWESESESSVSR